MTELIFVNPGVKVKGQYYCNVLLSQQMLPAIKRIAKRCLFTLRLRPLRPLCSAKSTPVISRIVTYFNEKSYGHVTLLFCFCIENRQYTVINL